MLSQSADSFRLCNGCKRFLIKSGGHKLGYQSVLISNKKVSTINKNEILPQISNPIMKSEVAHLTKLQEI